MEIKLKYLYGLTEDMQNPSYKDTFNELCNCIKNIDDQEIRLEFDEYCNATYKNYPDLPGTTKPNKSPAKGWPFIAFLCPIIAPISVSMPSGKV